MVYATDYECTGRRGRARVSVCLYALFAIVSCELYENAVMYFFCCPELCVCANRSLFFIIIRIRAASEAILWLTDDSKNKKDIQFYINTLLSV